MNENEIKERVKTGLETLSDKIGSYFESRTDLSNFVLKGHLVVESEISDFLERNFTNPEFYKKANLRFSQKMHLFFSFFEKSEKVNSIATEVAALNNLRNKLAHTHLQVNQIESDIDKLIELLKPETPASTSSRQHKLVAALSKLCTNVKGLILIDDLLKESERS